MLASFSEWKALTKDQWILDAVQGYKIEFDLEPWQNSPPKEIRFSKEEEILVDEEASNLLKEGAIVPSAPEPDQFISNIFLVPKPNGRFRPVINLKSLNQFVHYEHFKQETFPYVLELIQRNDFFTVLDLHSAYFSIPMHLQSQKYLKFIWRGVLYTFISFCFGLSSSPRVFTKVLKPVFALFRQLGMRCSYYINDSLKMHADRLICQSNANFMYQKLCCLGFVNNEEKSCLVPCQRTKFFGFILDSVLFMVFLPPEKVEKIEKMALYLWDSKQIRIRELASFIGLLINAFYAVLEAPLHYRALERQKVKSLEVANNFERKIVLSSVSKDEITWWLKNVKGKNGKKIRPDVVSHWIQTDASNLGYGGFFVEKSVSYGGRWTAHESKHHINYLELLAMFKVLKFWFSGCKDIHIGIQSDSMVAISYIQRMGGIASLDLDMLACEIWNWCIQRNIFISAYFLPGSENLEADFCSRNFSDTTEFRLKREIFFETIRSIVANKY